ncbi:hypothetical protein PVAND_016517 [Polypedilum vanderplanki]|uniref:Uncharacterized protein n=1 Tax=Polypedilum vanderplanki TaxID=319348 RepID=A0A9J6BFC4_POLVA|nr:hypothetical protein PVAND_016517 [Polypedilum vanderplanki]
MKIEFVIFAFLVIIKEISAGCDSRCEVYNAAFLEIFDKIQPFTESNFYENELLQALQNLPVESSNAEKIAAIDDQLNRIHSQIEGFYATIAALISAKLPDLTDLKLIESILAGDHPKVVFPYDCLKAELEAIALKLQFLFEDSVRFAQILKDLACTKVPQTTPSPSKC